MQHRPHAEDVAPGVRRPAGATLRTGVGGAVGLEHGRALRIRVQTESDHLDLGFAERCTGRHDSARRHVPMDEAGVVHRFQTRGDLEYELEGFPDRVGRSRAQEIPERLPTSCSRTT